MSLATMSDAIPLSAAGKIFADELSDLLAPSTLANWDKLNPADSLADYIRAVFHLEPARHHMKWIAVLEDEKQYPRILIISPPGHAKTTVGGIAYPSWKIGNNPGRHFMYYGNTQTQAEKQSIAIRDLVLTDPVQRVFPNIRRSRKGWAGAMWYLERPEIWDKDPTMFALGVDGPGLGSRADEIVFDDVCDPQNMATQASRRKVKDQIAAVAFSRQSGKSREANRMVAVMTRWHEDDLAQFFEKEGFHTIWMPATGYWEYVEPLGREIKVADLASPENSGLIEQIEHGKPLWEEEYDLAFFQNFRDNQPHTWMLEYQGVTVKPGGNIFDSELFLGWDNKDEGAHHLDPYAVRAVFQFWDTAGKAGAENDYWVCETWVWANDGYYMLNAYAGKHEFSDGVAQMRVRHKTPSLVFDGDGNPIALQSRMIFIEDTGINNGSACVSTLGMGRYPAQGISPVVSKEERAGQAKDTMRNTPCYFPLEESAYTGIDRASFFEQHYNFPRGKHDDAVDVTSMAINHLASYPVTPGADWKAEMTVNSKTLGKEMVRRGASMMTRAGGSKTRLRRGMFGGGKRGSFEGHDD